MKAISVLIKPASSLCNLRCKYCFYANVSSLREVRSFGKMKSEVAELMIENIYKDLEDGDRLTLAFQGGEPTYAGLSFFRAIVDFVKAQSKDVEVHYAIQTNGTLINRLWCKFLKENDFLVGLSIDGNSRVHDLNRLDPHGRGTFQKILATKHLFDKYEIEYNVLCVLTETLSKDARSVFEFIKDEKISFVQFIPCLDDLDTVERSNFALSPEGFVQFYRELLPLWLKELKTGCYISIKLFDDLINLLVRSQVTACGILGNCQVQYVIEADGSVYPCDFFVLDEYRMGYIQESTLRELFERQIRKSFACSRKALPEKCGNCPFYKMCRGGCKRMKDAMYVDEATDFCGYQELLREFIPRIPEILFLLEWIEV